MQERVMVKNFNNDDLIDEEELLAFINDFIQENVLTELINECMDEDVRYLKSKDRELRWLAARTRFKAINLDK